MAGYSLGMRQRLGIAAALLSDPKLLLLDEPANGLDPAGIVAMRDTLRNLAAQGKTVFVSSHLLGEVQQLADVVGIIALGKLVREGRIGDLLSSEGHVRVRVAVAELPAARAAVEALAGPAAVSVETEHDQAWLSVRIEPARAAEVNRTLAGVGVYVSRLEAGADLESLFLELTGGDGRAGRQPDPRGRGMRIFLSTIRKLLRRPATLVTIGILLGLMTLIYLAVGATAKQIRTQPNGEASLLLLTFPDAYDFVLSFTLGLGGLLALVYGAAIAGSEWSWGTLKTAVARGEGRVRYTTLTFAGITLLLGVGLLLAFVFGVVMAIIGAGLAGIPTTGISDSETLSGLPEQLLRGWLALTEQAAIGFAIATIARSQLAGIGAGIGIYFAEQFASIFLPDVVKYLPFNVANAILAPSAGLGGGGGGVARLEPNEALVMVVVWLVGALAVAGIFTERADIGG